MGDGVLIEFASAVDAVACAVEMHKRFAMANHSVPEQRRIVMRYLRAASHEEVITATEAMAMTAEHVAEPHEVKSHEVTGKFRFAPDAYAAKPDAHVEPAATHQDKEEKKEDGGE